VDLEEKAGSGQVPGTKAGERMRMIWFPQSQDLFAASLALQDADPALRNLELFRQEADQGGIGRTIHGSCLYPDFQALPCCPAISVRLAPGWA